ncbi:MAG: thiamine pyrophosphate-binding protein [Virgibacillus proomii]
MATVAAHIVEMIREQGCQFAFGVPGKPIVPLILEMEKQGIDFVLARHECGAGYMATGYAMQNDSLSIAIGTSGPGGTNLITAAAQAKAYHAPVLFITGHPPLTDAGKPVGQDSSMFGTDLTEMFRPVTLFSAKVEDASLLKNYVQHALEKALTGAKGPVHLSIPLNVLIDKTESFTLPSKWSNDIPVSGNLEQASQILYAAQRPVLLLGKGVHIAKAYRQVLEFVEKWNIPVMTTPGGKGTFPTKHRLSLGAYGLGGTAAASAYMEEGVDVMVVIGSKLSDMSIAGLQPDHYPKTIIHFDPFADFVGKSIPVETLFVQGDAKVNLHQLNINYFSKREAPDLQTYWQKEMLERENEQIKHANYQKISTAAVMKCLRGLLPEETIVFGDDGSHTFHAIKHFDIVNPGTFFFDDVFGAMGHGLNFAIGAKIAEPETPIVSFTGDGCMMMHGTEISTAVNQQAHMIFFVFNNGMLDMVDKGMLYNLGRSVGTRYGTEMNAAKFAESLGATGYRCMTMEEVIAATKTALKHPQTAVIEIIVEKEEVPPTLKRG